MNLATTVVIQARARYMNLKRKSSMLGNRMCKSTTERAAVAGCLALAGMAPGTAGAGGMMIYELGTADVGLASAGYNARAYNTTL